ncbi:MAG TPA: AAA family ATPase, partial [Candidatus Wunengus sp. YC63]|uniref:AAA family ATPase n=1 Tax=Candidatus Wunengus sp. YC63 TaxID=3367699 RepID=UPI0040279EA9
RLILGGDTRQHASVVRGDALRILNTVGGIRTAEVDKIYRQKDAAYRNAVAELSKGNIWEGFQQLDAIDAIKQVDPKQPYARFIKDYMASVKAGKDVLVISPTHDYGERITREIRESLKQAGYIGKREIEADRLKNLNLTTAQKTDWRNLNNGLTVQFNQNQKGIKRGSRWEIAASTESEVLITDGKGKSLPLDVSKPEQFDVFKKTQIAVARGDKIQITKNGFDRYRQRLDNGVVLEVMAVSKKNGLSLRNSVSKMMYEIDADFGNIAHAHCLTSHASQGKTVDEVFIAQPAATFPATNAKQFYVSVSRAREKVHIYTNDKEELLVRASQAGDRVGAMELVKNNSALHMEHVLMLQRQQDIVPAIDYTPHPAQEIDKTMEQLNRYEDYEPGL